MLLDTIEKGSTDYSVEIRIIDSTDGTPETGVVHNTSGIDLWYRRQGAVSVDITEVALSALTDAHSDGGFLHINDGVYRLDLPDAAVSSGADYVAVGGTVTGMIVLGGRVKLTNPPPFKKGRAYDWSFLMVDATTKLPVTGATVTVTRSINQAAFGAATIGAVVEVGNGIYMAPLAAADMNGDEIVIRAAATGCETVTFVIQTEP